MRRRLRSSALISVVVTAAFVTPAIGAGIGGRITLTDPIAGYDSRGFSGNDPPVTSAMLGSGVLQVFVWSASGVAGTATIYPCGSQPPAGQVTFRLGPDSSVQNARFATSEQTCLMSTMPVHVAVHGGGTVSATPISTGLQYVPLAASKELFSGSTVSDDQTIAIARPTELTGSATAAVVAVEVLTSDHPGYLVVYGCAHGRSLSADLGYNRNRVANVAYVRLDATEDMCVYAFRPVQFRVRLLGELAGDGSNPNLLPPSWRFTPGEVPAPSLRPITPVRVLDTRIGLGRAGTSKLPQNEVFELDLKSFVGPHTTAVALNVTVTEPDSTGFLTVWPCGGDRPLVSNLNFVAGETVPNLVVSKLSPGGTICMSGVSNTHLIADLNGTYEVDGGLNAVPVEPKRILDTRLAIGVETTARLQGGHTIELQIGGVDDVPVDVGAVTINVTSTQPDRPGFLTVHPCGPQAPDASNVNYVADQTVANLVTAKLSSTGTVCIYTSATTHVVVDIAAWYGVDRPAGLIELSPSRILDTRTPLGVPVAAKVGAGEFIVLDVVGHNGVAPDAEAVVMNVTVTEPEGNGFVTVWPCDRGIPTVSNLNYSPGETNPNLVTVKLAADGTVCLFTLARAHLLADVAGYLTERHVPGQVLMLG